MPLTLVFKRAKNFVLQDNDGGTKKFLAQANPSAPIPAPFWIVATPTYKQGILDGSIVNLTPPTQIPGYKAAVAVEEEPTPEQLAEADAAENAVEQQEVPQAAFGGQPMTPVQPGPKLGIQGAKKR